MTRIIATVLAALLAVAVVLVASPLSAEAATLGPGYEYQGQAGSHIGGYLDPDGTISYCINAGAPSAVGKVTTDVGVVDSVNGLDAATMVRLNALLSAHGNTSDDNTAAAVAMAVWSIAGPGAYNAEGGDRYVLGRAPASERAAIQALADAYRDEAAGYSAPSGTATLTLTVDPTNTALGWLDVAADGTGSVQLVNAVFADSQVASRDGVGNGAHLAIVGTPSNANPYRVSAAGSFTGAASIDGAVHLYTTPGSQSLTASGTSTPITFSASATDTVDRVVPAISTNAQPTAVVGGTVSDTAVATGVPSAGEQLSWSAYLQPDNSAVPVCTDAQRVFSSTDPLTITVDGSYASEPFPVGTAAVGRLYWIVTASVGGVVVAHGDCGDATEVSVVLPAAHLPVVSG